MSISNLVKVLFVAMTLVQLQVSQGEEDLNDFDFSPGDDQEMMIAQESRSYTTVVKPPIIIHRPNGITNSHRPQYNLDSYEQRQIVEESADRSSVDFEEGSRIRQRMKESMIREAMLRALEKKDHITKFAQVLPIIRAMSGSQRVALASLVASQVSAPAHRRGLTLNQVRSMFGPETNSSSELMLPILLDMANLFRRAARAGKRPRSAEPMPQPQMLRRSFTEDDVAYDDNIGVEDPPEEESTTETATTTEKATPKPTQNTRRGMRTRNTNRNAKTTPETTTHHSVLKLNNTDTSEYTSADNDSTSSGSPTTASPAVTVVYAEQQNPNSSVSNGHSRSDINGRSSSSITSSINSISSSSNSRSSSSANSNARMTQNTTIDQTADATNNSLAEDLPVAEKLRSWYHERKASGGKPPRRPVWSPQPGKPHSPPPSRRGESSAAGATVTGGTVTGAAVTGARRRPAPARKLQPARPADHANCELFTNSLCLEAEDYPTEAILSSLRRNKAATGALLADYKEQAEGAGAVDGVTAAQEASYTADTYLNANRRGDNAGPVRDFAAAGEAGFMCPSTVKYARPQRARATSGTWKYIVNTGEHTQTLRLEKCLKPKEACTYLTDNFKSKCVQVYNYHRLLTWDQQNGLHMDIFKVPTCCSCHIEGYSVSFPPLGHRTHETSSEHFPGQDLSQETSNPFESALGQSTVPRPSVTKTGHSFNKPIESYAVFSDAQNIIPGAGFNTPKFSDGDELGSYNGAGTAAMDSYGNSYFPDSFNQASAIRNVKKPPTRTQPPAGFDTGVTLPSYLEPPTRSAAQSSFFGKSSDTPNKFKHSGTQYKRVKRPGRRPIRKTASGGAEDLMPSGSSLMETATAVSLESMEDFSDLDDFEIQSQATNRISSPSSVPPLPSTTEAIRTTQRLAPNNHGAAILKDISLNKRVNYNYHPIIDFFESSSPGEKVGANDREDNAAFSSDSEWKPMSHPLTRSSQVPKALAHHRHK